MLDEPVGICIVAKYMHVEIRLIISDTTPAQGIALKYILLFSILVNNTSLIWSQSLNYVVINA